MTHQETCAVAVRLGGKEFPSYYLDGTRHFEFRDALPEGSAPCVCNDRPPALHVNIHTEVKVRVTANSVETILPGKVTFCLRGERPGGDWIYTEIYSVSWAEFEAALPRMKATAAALWGAFVATANG